MVKKFIVCRDDSIYQAFPDVTLTSSGKLICVFAECNHHHDRSYTRIMFTTSTDRGRTWSQKKPLTEPTKGFPFWNCPRISRLKDDTLVVVVDKLFSPETSASPQDCRNYLYFSEDEGKTWEGPWETPALGIVPDKILELKSGRWILSCHYREKTSGFLVQRLWFSDDRGRSWNGPVIVAREKGLNLCEVSLLEVEPGMIVAFHRENSGQGWDCFKTVSTDNGASWSQATAFPLPGCHRPVAGFLKEGWILITYRFMPGGKRQKGWWTQNLFAALTDKESALAEQRNHARVRIMPLDFDRSSESDTGYSGWVQFPDGEIYVVNYLLDDAPKAWIRGYSFFLEEMLLPGR